MAKPITPDVPDVPNDQDFVTIAFQEYWDINRRPEPTKYFSIREAMQALREFTKMSQYDIAAYLGVTYSLINLIENGNRSVSAQNLGLLRDLAKSYTLPVLVDFFETCRDAAVRKAPAKAKSAPIGSTGSWMDEMGQS